MRIDVLLFLVGFGAFLGSAARADSPSPRLVVSEAEARRVEMIERVSPSVVCVYDKDLHGGGSGVLIDPEGYGLTNFHVVAAMVESRRGWGGLGDGILYELEVLGIDVTGDLAMFRLLPPKSDYRFPYARLGDSDSVRLGDPAFALGNPFILSEDYSPTVTMGIVTGVHRYQWGVKGNLTYSDCIQMDAPINPGNSGGPLFNAAGEVIGINGRISVNTRGRFNVGFGYAIASRQVRRFMPALRAGLLALHGDWGARVADTEGRVEFADVRDPGAAYTAGLRRGDRLVSLGGMEIQSANQVISLLGTYPAGWPVPVTIDRDGTTRQMAVRLDPVLPKMREPFQPSRQVNVAAVRRALQAYRLRTLGDAETENPQRWKYTLNREERGGADRPCETYEILYEAGRSTRMRQLHQGDSVSRLIEFDAAGAVQKIDESDEGFELPLDQKMIYGSLSLLHAWLAEPVDEPDETGLAHLGGSALVSRYGGGAEQGRPLANSAQSERLVEIVETAVAEQASARVFFDADSFAILRIQARDRLGGTEVTLDFGDHRLVDGVYWPTTVDVYGKGIDYRDTLSDWEIER